MSFIEGESADLTWVYAVGAGVAVIIIIGIIIICRRVKHQSKITQAVKKRGKRASTGLGARGLAAQFYS